MKKQILIVTLMVLAVFAGLNKSYGQVKVPVDNPFIVADGLPVRYVDSLTVAVTCMEPTPLTCSDSTNALHPQVGLSYEYSVDVVTAGARIHWFVTDTANIIAALNDITHTRVDPGDGDGAYIIASGAPGVYNNSENLSPTVTISWKSFDPTAVVLLVTYVVDAAGCTDNIEVYRIQPVFNFTLDIAGIAEGAATVSTDTLSVCVSPIESATYTPGTPGNLAVDYGENWLFFQVVAANFTHSWMPKFQVNYSGTTSDPITVEWAYPADAVFGDAARWHSTTGPSYTGGGTDAEFASGDSVSHSLTTPTFTGADDGTGECIVVRVRVDHGDNENPQTTTQILTLGVNGTMYDANAATPAANYTNNTLDDLGEGTPVCLPVDYDDKYAFKLTPRPDITSTTQFSPTQATPIQQFEPKN